MQHRLFGRSISGEKVGLSQKLNLRHANFSENLFYNWSSSLVAPGLAHHVFDSTVALGKMNVSYDRILHYNLVHISAQEVMFVFPDMHLVLW